MTELNKRDGELKEAWYIACLSNDLKKEPLSVTLYDTPIVLFRNEEGQASALLDKCHHRAAPLSKGKIKKSCLVCPYHSWTYDEQGELKNIPSVSEGSLPRVKVRNFVLVEQDGVIWLWMGEKDPLKKPWSFPHKQDSSYVSYYMVTDFENEVTQLVENFIDVAHTITVHKGWFRNESFQKVRVDVETSEGSVLVSYEQPNDSIGVILSKLINPGKKKMLHTDKFIYPNLTRVDYKFGDKSHWIINSQCTPISTMKTRVYTHISYKMPLIGRLIKPLISFYTRKVINQDVDIMKIQGDNLQKFDENVFVSSSVDLPHVYINKLRKTGIANSAKVKDIQASKSIDMII